MQTITLYLGLDVHKDSITIAIAEPGAKGEIRVFGTITSDVDRLEKALARIRKAHPDAILEIAYEAGPCGLVIARRLQQLHVPCLVAAPSLIPKQPGSPFKTDQRDARAIARLLRAGELTAVYVPEATDEAIRDLCRARTDAVDDQRGCRHRLKAFLLRHGYRYQGKANWSQPHMRYLRELVLPHPAMKAILEEYLQGIDAAHNRVERIEASMGALLETWRLKAAVEALMAFRGFQLVAAMITVSELGDIHRFAQAKSKFGRRTLRGRPPPGVQPAEASNLQRSAAICTKNSTAPFPFPRYPSASTTRQWRTSKALNCKTSNCSFPVATFAALA